MSQPPSMKTTIKAPLIWLRMQSTTAEQNTFDICHHFVRERVLSNEISDVLLGTSLPT